MRKFLLPEGGKFYKANLHMHTTVSDGGMTPEEVKREYLKRGYSIVAYTDHEVLVPHNELTDDEFLAITSYEIATNSFVTPKDFNYEQTYHINLYSLDKNKSVSPVFTMSRLWPPHSVSYMSEEAKAVEWERHYSTDSINALIKKANEEGFIVSYNHPNWSLQNYSDYAALEGVWAVEWYNTGCARAGYPDTMQPIDDLCRQGKFVMPVATDDAHADASSLHDCFGGFVMVKADKLEYDTVMNALIRGDFYSSVGPEIKELYLEDGVLHVKTSPVNTLEIITERRKRWRRTAEGCTDWTVDLSQYFADSDEVMERTDWNAYFRISVIDGEGNQAHTRAYTQKDWK